MKAWIIISCLVLLSPVMADTVISFDKNTDNITITSFSSEKNKVLEVPVWVKNTDNISYLCFSILYDEEIIKPEKIIKGVDEIEYTILQDEIRTELDFNKNYTDDFLLMKITFRLTGYEGESSALKIEINNIIDKNKDELPCLLVDGIINIKRTEKNDGKENDGNNKIDNDLSDLMNAKNKSEYAEKNNLEFEDGKVKVVIETNDSKEEKFVSIDELKNLTNNKTITKINPYRQIPVKEIIIILAIIILLIILILKLRR